MKELFEYKSFSIIKDYKRSAIELTEMKKNHYYFNRLIVHESLRGQKISNQLLKQMVDWADENYITIHLDINPYGPLDYNRLKTLYEKFGFEEDRTEDDEKMGELVRVPRENKEVKIKMIKEKKYEE